MQVRDDRALRGINNPTADDNDTATATTTADMRWLRAEALPWPQGVRPLGRRSRPPAREARRCGHESRELQTAIVSHDND